MQRKKLFNLLKGVKILTAAGGGLNAYHACIWTVTTAAYF